MSHLLENKEVFPRRPSKSLGSNWEELKAAKTNYEFSEVKGVCPESETQFRKVLLIGDTLIPFRWTQTKRYDALLQVS